ncbi:hypothetical protein [Spirosoma gilvum]
MIHRQPFIFKPEEPVLLAYVSPIKFVKLLKNSYSTLIIDFCFLYGRLLWAKSEEDGRPHGKIEEVPILRECMLNDAYIGDERNQQQ